MSCRQAPKTGKTSRRSRISPIRLASRGDPFFSAPNLSSAATTMLVQTFVSPTLRMCSATTPFGWRTRSETMLVSRRSRITGRRARRRLVLDRRKSTIARRSARDAPPSTASSDFLGAGSMTSRFSRCLANDGLFAWQLEFARNAHGLTEGPFLNQSHASFRRLRRQHIAERRHSWARRAGQGSSGAPLPVIPGAERSRVRSAKARKRPQPYGRGPLLPSSLTQTYLRRSKAGTVRTLKGAAGSTLKSILKPDLRRACSPRDLWAAASPSRA